jgi:hypothetical protein
MSSFLDQTSSFFDELTKILETQQHDRDEGMDTRSDRPYSSLLTQDEEPLDEYNPQQREEPEPEVVTRGGS